MIYLDDREDENRARRKDKSAELIPHLEALGLQVGVERMDFADAKFLGRGPGGQPVTVGVEIKEFMDLVNSMLSGRLSGYQVEGLMQQYQYYWLLVEGVYRTSRRDGSIELPRGREWKTLRFGRRVIYARDIDNYLTTLEVIQGVRVRRTRTPYETARALASLYHWWNDKDFDQHRAHLKEYELPQAIRLIDDDETPQHKQRRLIARSFPGMGHDRAVVMADAFGSVEEMILADEKTLRQVPGVGRILARRIRQLVGKG